MTIRWLHLSDTHFREDELWDRRATLRALIAKVGELKEKGLAPDMVFVTGDIAWSGKPKEYEQATRFFHELNKVLELDPKDRWFLVPGNHDVDRSRIKAAHRAVTRSLQDEGAVEEILLKDPDSLRSLATRLDAYYTFAADFLGPTRAVQPDRPWRTDVREFNGTSIGILQLNSAWIAEGGDADNANLILGEAQVREALNDTPDAFLRIALMHHPLRSLREFDANCVESLLGVKGGAAFLLRGHLHLNRTKVQSSPDGNLFEIAAGTLYTDETRWPRGFHLSEVDLDKGEARIHLFRYSGEGIGFFASDNLTYENAPNGICKIKLPAAYRFGGKKSKPAKTISRDQRLSFTARYRSAAAAYHGNARFIGFPNQAARPNARVSDLFVPLRMKLRGEKTPSDSRTTVAIAQGLLGAPQHGWYRIVVLGDPGSQDNALALSGDACRWSNHNARRGGDWRAASAPDRFPRLRRKTARESEPIPDRLPRASGEN
jgi:predicted MPP superfamily phosphohydrolase